MGILISNRSKMKITEMSNFHYALIPHDGALFL